MSESYETDSTISLRFCFINDLETEDETDTSAVDDRADRGIYS